MEDENTQDQTAMQMMNNTAAEHSRNITEIPRDQTLMMEESKGDFGGNISKSDFLAGIS